MSRKPCLKRLTTTPTPCGDGVSDAIFPVLVTGASGQLGGMILGELLKRGTPPRDIIATSRNTGALARWAALGIETRVADFDRPGAALEASFRGAARALVISTTPEAPYVPKNRFRQQGAAIDAAVAAGVSHVFYTSAPNPAPPTPAFWKEDHHLTEAHLKACRVTWTVLRHWEWPDWHFARHWLPAVRAGRFPTASGDGRIAWITREDTAAADAGALLSPDVANRTIDVTGPEALDAAGIAGLLAELSGKPVGVAECAPGDLALELAALGIEPELLPIFGGVAAAIRLGRLDGVTPDAARLAGRPLVTMRAFLARALAQSGFPVAAAG